MSCKDDNDRLEKLFGPGRHGDLQSSNEESIDTLKYLIAGGFISTGTIATAVVYGRSIWVIGAAAMASIIEVFQ